MTIIAAKTIVDIKKIVIKGQRETVALEIITHKLMEDLSYKKTRPVKIEVTSGDSFSIDMGNKKVLKVLSALIRANI